TCLAAKKLGVGRCAARIRNPGYLAGPFQLHPPFASAVDLVVNPSQMAALELARLVEVPAVTYVDYFAGGRVTLIRLKAEPGAPITAGPLREVRPQNCVVAAVIRNGEVSIPDGGTHIQAGDRVLLLGPTARAAAIRSLASPQGGRIRNVLIAGGGHVGTALLRMLLPKGKRGVRVAVVEQDSGRC